MDRFDKLSDDMWDAVLPAWVGLSAVVVSPIVWMMLNITYPPTGLTFKIATGAGGLLVAGCGIWLSIPWFKARDALRRYKETL